MGKAKERRKKRRLKYLIGLQTHNSKGYKEELDKRMVSWADEIWEIAERGIINGLRTFVLAEQAKELVTETGQTVSEILEQECCRALSAKQGLNGHRLVGFYRTSPVESDPE